jgi:hypothetical protein
MDKMKLRHIATTMKWLAVLLFFSLVLICPRAWAGLLRITMNDGSIVEVPYFWEEGGEIKFEFAGGVVGIPKAQVTSVQEILASKAFDPEALLEAPKDATAADHGKKLQEVIGGQLTSIPTYEKLSPNESLEILSSEELAKKEARASKEVIYAPLFNLETDFADLVRIHRDGVLLVMQNIVSSRADLRNRAFTLLVYDSEGNVLQKKPCEVREVTIDRKAKKELEISGHIFTVMATIKPDPKIKRYEIVASRR